MNLIFDGPTDGPVFLFTHGAGAPLNSNFMEAVTQGLASKGIRVIRFNFPYMQQRVDTGTRRPPERAPKLIAQLASVIKSIDQPMVIGGKSMGGRMATLIASESWEVNHHIKAIACLGFPFHPAAKPQQLRTAHFPLIKQPVLIIQGDRDKLGSRPEVESYQLPSSIKWHWLADGDHDFKPRVKSGFNQQQHIASAIDALAEFIFISHENSLTT
ncbi:MAG: alpha/beta hydrolase [Gammaproteobacteria bacterium]|nr:alpha/beta hydrolase [Gammaproteobacteria bacterium]